MTSKAEQILAGLGGAANVVVPVVVMDAPKGSVSSPVLGQQVAAGDVLFAR